MCAEACCRSLAAVAAVRFCEPAPLSASQKCLCKQAFLLHGIIRSVDYTERARAAGAKIFTVSNSLYFHPKGQNVGNPMFFGLIRFNEPNSRIKLYCYCRNNVYNLRRYNGITKAALFSIKVLWYYTLTKFNREGLSIAICGLIDGITGNFKNHQKFLSSV